MRYTINTSANDFETALDTSIWMKKYLIQIANTIIRKMNTFNCFVFLLGQLIFLTLTEAFYETFIAKIKNNEEIIELKWKRTDQYLANENMPIWGAFNNTDPELIPDVMSQVGRFVMYHDTEHSSAVVYFENSNALFGVIDTRFYITGLPINQLGPFIYHKVGDDYVKDRNVRSNAENFHDFEYELSRKSTDDEMTDMNSNRQGYGQHRFQYTEPLDLTKPRYIKPSDANLTTLYPEILVFVSNEIVEHIKTKYPVNSSAILVSQYIIYFNAVDLLFAMLGIDNVRVHLNIAGIVMEGESEVFPYSYRGDSLNRLDAGNVVRKFWKYITKYRHIFVEDLVDYFFLSTKRELYLNNQVLSGITNTQIEIYDIRSSSKIRIGFLGSIVENRNAAGDYVVAAHEIAHVMSVKHDPVSEENDDNAPKCKSIMQIDATYCRNCLKWCSSSIEQFKTFARYNRDHCFLLNRPRSLHPYGHPIETLDPLEQCICYGHDTYYSQRQGSTLNFNTNCNMKIKCGRRNHHYVFRTLLPLDGTPCDLNRVCWKRECQSLI